MTFPVSSDTRRDGKSPMNRGLVYGAVAFAAVYALEHQWSKMQGDIGYVDSMRALSDEVPILKEQMTRIIGLAGWLLAEQSPAVAGVTRGIVQSLREDIVRYAKLDTM
jgi:hypothetical protein